MKSLLDILACPICHAALARESDELICLRAGHHFPIIDGVPILFPDGRSLVVKHEAPLTVRTGYDPWLHRNVLQSLTADQVVLDIGAGNMSLDDPCIVRMDVTLTPYVDVVADAHALPFQDESLDYVMSLAVLEHLRQPFVAAEEMYRVLKRGGYVYCDTNFVFAYHGYPHHYFNSTIHGIEQVFSQFRKLRSGVPPYQMPSYAVENILTVYLQHFTPINVQEADFIHSVLKVLSFPLRMYDAKFPQDVAYRVSAGVFFLGIKQIDAADTTLPRPILQVYARDAALRARYLDCNDLTHLDNIMTWARRDGRKQYSEIAVCLDAVPTFNKYWDERLTRRTWIESLPLEEQPVPRTVEMPAPCLAARPTAWWMLPFKAFGVLMRGGPRALIANVINYLRWLALRG